MSEFQGFQRKTFNVQAARVTPLNIEALAEACGGKVMHDGEKEGNLSRDYIKVRVAYPLNDEQTKARVGDWLVKQGRNYKVYKDKPFRNTFEQLDGKPVPQENQPKREQTPQKTNGPSPAQMPKKRTEVRDETGPEIVDLPTGQQIEPEGLPSDPEPVEISAPENPIVPEGEEPVKKFLVHDHKASVGCDDANCPTDRYVDGEHLFSDKIIEATPDGWSVTDEAPDQPSLADYQEVSEPEKKPITLDELNEMPGDPRSTQQILAGE